MHGWQQQQKLVASDRDLGDYFGKSVDIDGSTIVIGAHLEDHDADGLNREEKAGSVYIFTRSGSTWSQTQKVVASERWPSDFVGVDVSLDGDYLIVGAYGEDHDTSAVNYIQNAGAAYVFRRNGGIWTEQEKITENNRREDDAFGTDVAISGDIVIVGAPANDLDNNELNLKTNAGAAYIFSTGIGGISEPEIMVKGNDVEILNGDSSPSLTDFTNFDTTQVGEGTLIREFIIYNTGSGYLTIDSIYTAGISEDDFTFITFPPDSIAAGDHATVNLSFTPSAVGRRNTTVYIENNDADENPYNFIIQGAGKAPYSGGSGTEGDPFLISTFSDLLELSEMSHDWDKHFLQTNDIDASASDSLDIGDYDGDPGTPDWPMGFSPIGDSPTEGDRQLVAFSGSYDGDHHIISDLYIYRPYEKMVGLFGYVKNVPGTPQPVIKNLRLEDVDVYGGMYIGGLVGWNLDAVIDSCEVSGQVNAINGTGGGLAGFNQDKISHCHTRCYVSTVTAGGLVGYDEFGEIIACSASDTVFSIDGSAGGLVGSTYQTEISKSFSDCYVTGFGFTGGLVGRITYKTIINNCYARGEVNGQPSGLFSATGGFCGLVDGYGFNLGSTIENCYAMTDVVILSEDTTTDKGFVGSVTQTNTFTNNFFRIDPSGQLSDAAGAATPKDSTALRALATYTDITTDGLTGAWDFAYNYHDDIGNDDIWDMDTTGILNEGFPFLSWQNGDAVTLPEEPVALADDASIPDSFELMPAYPNPFNPQTLIAYKLPVSCHIDLRIYSVSGKPVATLVNEMKEQGYYEVLWNAAYLPSGLYIARLTAKNFADSKKIMLIK
ncbi:MAG: choice-of-anchor D domain-containing protein [Candidatus Marinimicrobia bacterium]|nr:choice-of-anchor D domain-containing protein [Candidatus Neomarinimicrobiota bacterium]